MNEKLFRQYASFSEAVAKALNDAKVLPPDGSVGSVLVVVGVPPGRPYGGSLNYDEPTKTWIAMPEVSDFGISTNESEEPN